MKLRHPLHVVKRTPLYLVDWSMSTPLPDYPVAAIPNPIVVDNKTGFMHLIYGKHYLNALKSADIGYVMSLVEGPLPVELSDDGPMIYTLEDLQSYFTHCRVRLRSDGLAFISE